MFVLALALWFSEYTVLLLTLRTNFPMSRDFWFSVKVKHSILVIYWKLKNKCSCFSPLLISDPSLSAAHTQAQHEISTDKHTERRMGVTRHCFVHKQRILECGSLEVGTPVCRTIWVARTLPHCIYTLAPNISMCAAARGYTLAHMYSGKRARMYTCKCMCIYVSQLVHFVFKNNALAWS